MEKDLTHGSVLKNIIFFSLPYLLSYFLQTLYGLADLYIIGQFNGTNQITSVSIGSQIMHMITVMIVGLAMGTTVTIGQAIGAKHQKKAANIIGNTATLFMLLSIIITFLLLLTRHNIVSVMSTPPESVKGTTDYLTVCFIGIPFITAYNIISSIFRGMGDSKSPMYFIAIACAFNIVLDYIFIGSMDLGPAGAALGTTIAQTISVIIAFIMISKKKQELSLTKECFKPFAPIISQILRIGIPVSVPDGFIQISFILITIIVNRRGVNDAAAVGIVEKIISFVFLVPSSMLSAVSAISAQNIGAGKPKRAEQTLHYAILICICFGAVISTTVQFKSEAIIALFDKNPQVIALGSQYIKSYIFDCIFAGMHFSFSGYFCALGKSGISFLHNSLSIILVRIPGAYLMSKWFPYTLFPMGLAATTGSLLSVIICVIAFIIIKRRGSINASKSVV